MMEAERHVDFVERAEWTVDAWRVADYAEVMVVDIAKAEFAKEERWEDRGERVGKRKEVERKGKREEDERDEMKEGEDERDGRFVVEN